MAHTVGSDSELHADGLRIREEEGILRASLIMNTTPNQPTPPALGRGKSMTLPVGSMSPEGILPPSIILKEGTGPTSLFRPRRVSIAEQVLEQVRTRDRDLQKSTLVSSPRTSWLHYPSSGSGSSGTVLPPAIMATASTPQESPTNLLGPGSSELRRRSLISPVPPNSPNITKAALPGRLLRTPSAPTLQTPSSNSNQNQSTSHPIPPTLINLLDGEHHTDEICVLFEVGWPTLEQWLVSIGGGQGNGDFGKVAIIYR